MNFCCSTNINHFSLNLCLDSAELETSQETESYESVPIFLNEAHDTWSPYSPAQEVQSLFSRKRARSAKQNEEDSSEGLFRANKSYKADEESAALLIQRSFRKFLVQRNKEFVDWKKKLSQSTKEVSKEISGQLSSMAGSRKIEDGYGDYIFYKVNANEESEPIDKELYFEIQNEIEKYKRNPLYRHENLSSLIQKKIVALGADVKFTFLPTILLDLFYLEQATKENLNSAQDYQPCPYHLVSLIEAKLFTLPCYKTESDEFDLQLWEEENLMGRLDEKLFNIFDSSAPENQNMAQNKRDAERNCWHLCRFFSSFKNNHPEDRPALSHQISEKYLFPLMHKFNDCVLKELKPSGSFSIEKLDEILTNRINFFKNEAKNSIYSQLFTESMEFSIKKALRLECSEKANRAFILYRTSDFWGDLGNFLKTTDHCSLSFGTSLFAGVVRDRSASVVDLQNLADVKGENKKISAYIIPYCVAAKLPIHFSKSNFMAQMSSEGEWWHPRSKIKLNEKWINLDLFTPSNLERIKRESQEISTEDLRGVDAETNFLRSYIGTFMSGKEISKNMRLLLSSAINLTDE